MSRHFTKPVRANARGVFPRILGDAEGASFVGSVALGNGTQFDVFLVRAGGRVQAAIEECGAYTFANTVHYTYLMEKFPRLLNGDAMNFSDFLNDQLSNGTEIARQGQYTRNLTDEWQDG